MLSVIWDSYGIGKVRVQESTRQENRRPADEEFVRCPFLLKEGSG